MGADSMTFSDFWNSFLEGVGEIDKAAVQVVTDLFFHLLRALLRAAF